MDRESDSYVTPEEMEFIESRPVDWGTVNQLFQQALDHEFMDCYFDFDKVIFVARLSPN